MSNCIEKLMDAFKNIEKKGFKKVSDNEVGQDRHVVYTNSLKQNAKLIIEYSGGLINRQVPVSFKFMIDGKEQFSFPSK